MKKYSSVLIRIAISLCIFLFSIYNSYSQTKFIGTWEGTFMNDFKVLINFSINNQNKYDGNIKMLAGDNIIQNDKIINIKLSNDEFTFYIPDKETPFKGSFNELITELSGEFIFPDGSKHPIELKRIMDEKKPIEEFRIFKQKKIEAQNLRSDLIFLYTSLSEYHPQLYAFTSKDSITSLTDKLKREIDVNLTLEEFYLLTTKLTDAIKCSHTGVRLPNDYQNLINRFGNFFPFKLFFTNDRAFFLQGEFLPDYQISPGDEIISINQIPIVKIINQLFYFIPSEGCNVTTKYNELNKRFNSLFYLLDDSEEFAVTYKTGYSIEKIVVPASGLKELNMESDLIENKSQVEFNYIDNKAVGKLKVPSFAISNMDHYLQKLDSIFGDLRKTNTQDIILDLRNNSGGHPIFAAQLFSYLTNKDFAYFKRNEVVKEFEPLYNTMHHNKLSFNGNLYIFINGGCLSTTGHLISLLKYNTDAIFIGEEPGSTFRCNDYSLQLSLPNTGIKLNVPRTTFETSVSGFSLCDPFSIDFRVKNTVTELINGEDAYMELFKNNK